VQTIGVPCVRRMQSVNAGPVQIARTSRRRASRLFYSTWQPASLQVCLRHFQLDWGPEKPRASEARGGSDEMAGHQRELVAGITRRSTALGHGPPALAQAAASAHQTGQITPCGGGGGAALIFDSSTLPSPKATSIGRSASASMRWKPSARGARRASG
jgi:hypothetical protein